MADRSKTGAGTRREVLGEAYVDKSNAAKNTFNERFIELITESAWGHVWSDPTLSKRDRSLITIALLAAQGNKDELALHLRATKNTGASHDEVREALLHVAIYSGVPKANSAIKIAQKILAEGEEESE
ncbi:MAG: 4-carboxymuconolactone decarboxylase [Pseudomonadota bacterium]